MRGWQRGKAGSTNSAMSGAPRALEATPPAVLRGILRSPFKSKQWSFRPKVPHRPASLRSFWKVECGKYHRRRGQSPKNFTPPALPLQHARVTLYNDFAVGGASQFVEYVAPVCWDGMFARRLVDSDPHGMATRVARATEELHRYAAPYSTQIGALDPGRRCPPPVSQTT
jgi:hypothetical protein